MTPATTPPAQPAGPADPCAEPRGLAALDAADAAVYTIGQAADLLGVTIAGLRRLDNANALTPHRTASGHRRYSRRHLQHAQRMMALIEQGTPITAAGRIAHLESQLADLEDQVAGLEDQVADLREQLPQPPVGATTAALTPGPPTTSETAASPDLTTAETATPRHHAHPQHGSRHRVLTPRLPDTASPNTASAASAQTHSPTRPE